MLRFAITIFTCGALLIAPLRAAPADDLRMGQQALNKGDVLQALELLKKASQALPASVEAQIALADCYLQMGKLKDALEQYQVVLKLSPRHVRAQQIVKALTDQRATMNQQLAGIEKLIHLGQFRIVDERLTKLLEDPRAGDARNRIRLLLSESRLWSGQSALALRDALRVSEESRDPKEIAVARILTALALLNDTSEPSNKVKAFVENLPQLPAQWQERAKLVNLILQSDDAMHGVKVSAEMGKVIPHLPESPYRTAIRRRMSGTLLNLAQDAVAKRNFDRAHTIVWPMISSAPFPKAEVLFKPITIQGGWLGEDASSREITRIAPLLATGRNEAQLALGLWIAGEVLRQKQGIAHQRQLAERATAIGKKHFDDRTATLRADANKKLDVFDALAITLHRRAQPTRWSEDNPNIRTILDRYASHSQWSAVIDAVTQFHSGDAVQTRRLAIARVRIREIVSLENQHRASGRPLPAELTPGMSKVLAGLVKEIESSEQSRAVVMEMIESQITRYTQMARYDLALQLIKSAQKSMPEGGQWQQALVLKAKADRDWTLHPKETNLSEAHQEEIGALSQLLKTHPGSKHVADAVTRVTAIANGYQERHGFDTAAKVLADFVKAHPDLSTTISMEYHRLHVILAKAKAELQSRKGAMPKALFRSAEDAIAAVVAFRKSHPEHRLAMDAERQLFFFAKEHAPPGSWSLVRDVLSRYEKAGPMTVPRDRFELMKAATYLGELNYSQGKTLYRANARLCWPNLSSDATRVAATDPGEQEKHALSAYRILMAVVKESQTPLWGKMAREQILWMVGFFENQKRYRFANGVLAQFLKDQPTDVDQAPLRLRRLTNQFSHAARDREMTEPKNWLDQRQTLFAQTRDHLAKLIKDNKLSLNLREKARLLLVRSYDQEANVLKDSHPVRSAGLYVRSVRELFALRQVMPTHSEVQQFPERAKSLADQLAGLGQKDAAIQVLQLIPRFDPLSAKADAAWLQIGDLHAQELANPLKAVEAFQIWLNRGNSGEEVKKRLQQMGHDLVHQNRYLEALHVQRVFVDSFPDDAQTPTMLLEIANVYRSTGHWERTLVIYQRIQKEHPKSELISQTRRGMAESYVHLGDWNHARIAWQQELQSNPGATDAAQIRSHVEVLEQLQRYQNLFAIKGDDQNNADAQFQMGRLVWDKLDNPGRAVIEMTKVLQNYPKSQLVDDARLNIGRALLALDRVEEARQALMSLPEHHPGSPLADDALFLLGQSYEKEARSLGTISVDSVRANVQGRRQREAFTRFLQQEDQQANDVKGIAVAVDQPKTEALASALRSTLTRSASDQLFCQVCEVEAQAELESVLRVASRQDRINDAWREAVATYSLAATNYPLGDSTDTSLSRMAQILESELKDQNKAIEAYGKIVKLFPGTPLAEDAAWKLASFFVAEKEYAKAVDAYRDFIRNYPASARVADAQFGQAQVLEKMGKWVDAMDAYEVFRQKFSMHPNASKALKQINWIKTYRRN